MHRTVGGFMRERLFAILVCAVILATGCSAGTPDSVVSEKIQSEAKKAEATKTAEVKEKKKESEKANSKDAAEADQEKTAEKTSKETAASEQKKAEEKKTEDKTAEKTSKETAASEQKKTEEKKTEDKSAEKASKETAASEEKKAQEKDTDKGESKKKEDTKKEKEEKKEETKKKEKDLKQESKEKYANDYIPDGFSPYGSYVLVYDSGYEVKTRLSKVGLTYYYESEEFLFTLDKNLPDMTREVAHILFNTAGPMDPANTGGEEFPFGEGFVIYISLDDGSYYEVPSYSLDLNGRVFARNIFETFRQRWEGAF